MRAVRSIGAALAVLALTSSCAEPTGANGFLIGVWATESYALSPSGSYRHHLTISRDGTFWTEVRSYSGGNGLTAFTRTEGTFELGEGRITFLPQRLVWWDSFYGVDSPTHVQEPFPWGAIFDDNTYSVDMDILTLYYTTYPADAPVPTTMRFRRQR